MPEPDSEPAPAIGYIALIDEPGIGLVGGCLVVSTRGRPLEFHCTEPVLPTRAQQLLHGATLRRCMVAEEIVPALLGSLTLRPLVVLTDDPDAPLAPVENPPQPVQTVLGEQRVGELVQQSLAELARHTDLVEPLERIVAAIREAHRIASEAGQPDAWAA